MVVLRAWGAADWLLDLVAGGGKFGGGGAEQRKWLFAPLATPPAAAPARGRIVCNCFDVSQNEIVADLRAGLDFTAVQDKRKCGTNCGSCLPELKRLATTNAAACQA